MGKMVCAQRERKMTFGRRDSTLDLSEKAEKWWRKGRMKYVQLVKHTKFKVTIEYLDDGVRWMAEWMSLEF